MSTEIRTVRTETFEMDYFRFGNEGKRPVIVLPGLSIQSVMPAADAIITQFSALSEDFDVYVFDRRKDIPEGYRIADMAEDMHTVLQVLQLKEVNLYGVSQGGMIAQTLTLSHPEDVHAIALCSTACRIKETEADGFVRWISLAEERKAEDLVMAFSELVYSPAVYAQYKDFLLQSAAGISDEDLQSFVLKAKATTGFDVYDKLDQIHCPVMVFAGSEDRVLHEDAAIEIAERLGCEMYIYAGYGHAVYDEAPDFVARVSDFYRKYEV